MFGTQKASAVAELARQVGGTLLGPGDVSVTGINSMAEAGPTDITFIADVAHARRWSTSKAAAALVATKVQSELNTDSKPSRPLIVVPDAEAAVTLLLGLFQIPEVLPEVGIHPSSVVHPTATLGKQVRIGPHVSVDQSAVIGDGVVLHAGVRIYPMAQVGAGTVIHANVVIRENCKIGRQCILHQNVSIGADGFGYRPAPNGAGLTKIPHIGNVIIEDAVEIGANTCVDRGKFGSTIVGAGTKIDNQCQIAHNCRVGRACVIAGQSGIGGSTIVGDGVQIGGRVGVIDHIRIGSRVKIGAGSMVLRDIPDGEEWLGYPAAEAHAVLRQWASLRKLPALLKRLSHHFLPEKR